MGVSRTIYVNVDSPNLGFPYFNFLGEAQCKKQPVWVSEGNEKDHIYTVDATVIRTAFKEAQMSRILGGKKGSIKQEI